MRQILRKNGMEYKEDKFLEIDIDTISLKNINKALISFFQLTKINSLKIQEIEGTITGINRELKRLSDALKKIDGTSEDERDKILKEPINSVKLGLQTRSSNTLRQDGIFFVGELIEKTEYELRRIPDLGRKTLREIKVCLERHNLYLKDK